MEFVLSWIRRYNDLVAPGIERKMDRHPKRNLLFQVILSDDPLAINDGLSDTSWPWIGWVLGLLFAVFHLILVQNPAVRYRMAIPKVKGLEVTLPEAMASVEAWGWFGLVLIPLLLFGVILLIASILRWVGKRDEKTALTPYLGIVVSMAAIFLLGQIIGYIIIRSGGLEGMMDLRDLSPGVGFGLLPFFAIERIGPFFKEVARGFDIFGLWIIIRGATLFRSVVNRTKLHSIIVVSMFYVLFLALRWFAEGPGYLAWHYFWTAGSGTL